MLRKLNWLPVKEYFQFLVLVFVFKIQKGEAPNYMVNKLVYNNNIHAYNTRQQKHFFIPPKRSKGAENSVFHKGLKEFNDLPDDVKNSSTIKMFKTNLKMFILKRTNLIE